MTSGIVRRGDQLLRPMGPWSNAVHEYLRHLEAAGFEGSPRVLGIEGDREVLTFIDGEVAADPRWQPGHGHPRFPANHHQFPFRPAPAAARGDRLPRRPRPLEHRLPARYPGRLHRLGRPPSPWTHWPTSPQPPGRSCRSHHPVSFMKRDSTRSLTYRPGCAHSWTLTAYPTAWPSFQRCGAAHWTSPKRCAGSKTCRQTSPAHYDRAINVPLTPAKTRSTTVSNGYPKAPGQRP